MKVLIADKLSPKGVKILTVAKGVTADDRAGITPAQLKRTIGKYDALIVRSRTKVTADVIRAGKRLKVIGRAGVGVDNVDVKTATQRGILVMNAPEGNMISTCELTLALMLSLARQVVPACRSLRGGAWERKKFIGTELSGKLLGIIGLGRIGSEVARRARAFDMSVMAHDPFVAEEKAAREEVQLVSLAKLFKQADYITVHTPLTTETRGLIGEAQLRKMKTGVYLINCSRGGVIDEAALAKAIKKGKVAGCALDVFASEPPADSPLLGMEQVVVTPHLGASTREAQQSVAEQIARQVLDALEGRTVRNAVNLPQISPEVMQVIGPYIDLAEKLGRLVVQWAPGRINRVRIVTVGEMNAHNTSPIVAGLAKGLVEPVVDEAVNYISAPSIARERGLEIVEEKRAAVGGFANLIEVEAEMGRKRFSVAGTRFADQQSRLVRIGGYHVDVVPQGNILLCVNHDRPGVISHVTTVLAKRKINIANMTVGRDRPGGKAVTVLNIDEGVSDSVLRAIESSKLIVSAKLARI